MRVGIFSGRSPRAARRALLDAVLASRADGRRRPRRARSTTAEPYVVPAVGEQRFTVAAIDLGIKAMTPPLMAAARHRGARAAGDGDHRATSRELGARRGLLLQRPRRPGDRRARGRAAARGARRADPVLRHLLRQPAPRPGARLRHLQAEVRPPRHQPAGDGPHHRQGRGDRAQPRLRRRRPARPAPADAPARYGRVRGRHVCLNDDVVEGLECLDMPGVLRAVPPRGGRRPARRRLPLRPLRRADGPAPLTDSPRHRRKDAPDAQARRHHSPSWSSAPARSSSARPASSTTPAPRPAGCCARRASGSSWSTPTRPRS